MFRKVLILYGVFQISIQQQFLVPQTKTSPYFFPYHAYVESDLYCLGALISTKFVVVNAICIDSQPTTTVYLGRSEDPYYTIFDPREGQVIKASELIVHPQFSKKLSKNLLPYNIGLVKLVEPAMITKTVRPISLASANQFPLQPGSLLNVTGYLDTFFKSNILRYMTVRVRSQSECRKYYGKKILKDEEHCVEGLGDRLDWPGPLAMNGKLVGLSRVLSQSITCLLPIASCKPQDVFLTLGPYIDWIYETTGISPSGDDNSSTTNNSYDHHISVPPRKPSTNIVPGVVPPIVKIPDNTGFRPVPGITQPNKIDGVYPSFPVPEIIFITPSPPTRRTPKYPVFRPLPGIHQPNLIGENPYFPQNPNVFTPSPPKYPIFNNKPSGPGPQFYHTQKTEQAFQIQGFQFGDGITIEGYKADPIHTHNQAYEIEVPV